MFARRTDQRAWRSVAPGWAAALLALLLGHLGWRAQLPLLMRDARALPAPPTLAVARTLALGDPMALAKFYTLWLQAFDTQTGAPMALRALDYSRVIEWLRLCLALDPRAQYPLLAASRLYAEVPDPVRSRAMLEFVAAQFEEDPNRRWPWLAHAVYLARHRLHDQALALQFARQLSHSSAPIPAWARQLEIFVLEDLGEVEAAKILLGGLLASGQVADSHERWLLLQRLQDLERRDAQ
jgi:hypothetical protein